MQGSRLNEYLMNYNVQNHRMTQYKKLLLIDDDADDHEFFLEAIAEIDSSITCTSFLDSEKALLRLKENESDLPDLIILDTNMPKLGGRQLLALLKQDSRLRGIPVIMYSTFFSDRDNDELTKLGAAHYLAKPSKFEDFRSALKEILHKKWGATSPAVSEAKQ
jgi:CheY-like chemotaxis protein